MEPPHPTFIYLHGFTSSPTSRKARFFADRLADRGVSLIIPDLNEGDFFHLTTARAVRTVLGLVDGAHGPVVIIGSSFGGRVAAHAAYARPERVQGLVLMAPAFHFERLWRARLGTAGIERWQREGELWFDHTALGAQMPLAYEAFEDVLLTDGLPRLPDTLTGVVFHGDRDETVPLEDSRRFVSLHPELAFHILDGDHRLHDRRDEMWTLLEPDLRRWGVP
jgi:hypothetical protein